MRSRALFAALVLIAAGQARATDVIGNINVDTVWDQAGSPYVLTGDVIVQPQAGLTIEPGVQVVAALTDGLGSGTDANRVELVIRGRLHVQGSLAEPVVFTSSNPDPGTWYGLLVDTGAGDSELAHAVIRGAEIGLWARTTAVLGVSDLSVQSCVTGVLWQSSQGPVLDRVEVAECTGQAIVLEDDGASGASAIIADAYVHDCAGTGLVVSDRVSADLVRSRVWLNQVGVSVQAGGSVSAVNNILAGNRDAGFVLAQAAGSPFWILNNTLDRNVPLPSDPLVYGTGTGVDVLQVTDAASFVVRNNLVTNHGGTGIRVAGGTQPSLDHNDVWNNTSDYQGAGAGPGSVSVNPLYTAPLSELTPWTFVSQPVSVRNPGDNYSGSWTFEQPGATHMRLVIPYLSTEPCCDRLYLYRRDGSQLAVYSGSFSGTSAETDGDYIRTVFSTDGSVDSTGFDIDGYEYRRTPASANYRLDAASPVIDIGNDLDAPAEDADGTARPYDGDVDGTATTDMGAYEWHENIGPLAVAGPDHTVLPGTVIDFDAGASSDPDGSIVSYEWDFGDGSPSEEGIQVSHTFATLGDYTVTLTVTDDQGAFDTDSLTVTVADNLPPVADAGPDQFVDVGDPVNFDGGGSADPDGTIISYEWDFGDGSPAGAGRTVSHTYARQGVFTVSLTVTDNRDATAGDTCAVVVGGGQNQPPVADPGGPYSGMPGADIAFDGTGSVDPDGSILSYDWDFGDGQTGAGAQTTHAYGQAGAFLVRLTVTDDGGATDQASTLVNITDTGNIPPTADAGGPYAAQLGEAIAFDARASSDPDGQVVDYAWDFGDGQTGSGAQLEHTYQTAGNYLVRLTVTDDGGLTDEDTALANVTVPGNDPPDADAGDDRVAQLGQSLLFDASGSSDADGSIVSYEWDFGDGQTADGIQASHAYQAAGAYLVRLTVTDDDGALGQDVALVNVVGGPGNQLPTADAGGNQRVDAGQAVLLDGSNSSDPDGQIVSWEWDLGDGDFATGQAVQHTFETAGAYLVRLKVTDDAGASDEDFALIEVVAPDQPGGDSGCGCDAGGRAGRPWSPFGLLILIALRRRR